MFIAQRLVGPSKQLKQIIQIEHNMVKNPNWPEANQLAIYKRGRGFELGITVKQLQLNGQSGTWIRDLRIQESGALTTRPRYLLNCLHRKPFEEILKRIKILSK